MNPGPKLLDLAAHHFREFARVIQALRTPGTGCPWDLEQDHETLRPFLLEETYEVLDAIDAGDDLNLREELGDLLLQVVLHAQVGADRGAFTLVEVIEGITAKMVRRHPHVFGSQTVSGSGEVLKKWDEIKAQEKAERGQATTLSSGLARLPEALPALLRAQRFGEKTAKAGSDAGSLKEVLAGVCEGLNVLEETTQSLPTTESPQALCEDLRAKVESQLGEVLFQLCQLARWTGINAEDCLRMRAREYAGISMTRIHPGIKVIDESGKP